MTVNEVVMVIHELVLPVDYNEASVTQAPLRCRHVAHEPISHTSRYPLNDKVK